MQKKILLCMTSNFDFDQRMQRHAATLQQYFDICIFNRSCKSYKNYYLIDSNCIFKKGVLFYLEFNLRLFIHLFRFKYDVVYLVDTDTLLAGGIVATWSRCAFVFDSHEWFTEVPELEGSYFKKKVWQAIEKMCIKKMNLCFTVNDSLAHLFSNFFNKTFISLRNVPMKRNKLVTGKTSKKIIIYQGAVNKGRGLEVAIDAMEFLPGFELHIYGHGDILSQLVTESEKKGLGEMVKFMGIQSPETLWTRSIESYIGLNLLEGKSLNYYYSLANKFFDYMHAEIPSINMAYPEYLNILKDYEVGLVLESLNAQALANKIVTLDDPVYRHKLIANCIKYKPIFCWEKEQTKLIDAINGLTYN
jgi:glycosyltransferase involved in cell wall biosynthesis